MKKPMEQMKRECLVIGNLANLDVERESATGVPEVILARGKNAEDLCILAEKLLEKKGHVIITKAKAEHFEAIDQKIDAEKKFNKKAGVAVLKKGKIEKDKIGRVAIFAAGTADIPVAEEARIVLEEFGCEAVTGYDIGVAGMHRVFPSIERASDEDVDVIIVVAGMEGTLASVVKSMVDVPVIGVPTSIGYGYGGEGTSALMSMLQSCSPGITVVNIDNGFGAASAAYLICKRISENKGEPHA